MKSKKRYFWIGIAIVLVGGYYWYRSSHQTSTAIQYKTTAATRGGLVTSVSGSGNIVVDQLASIDPTITGTVSNLTVAVGDSVKKGDTLFTIVNDDLSVSNNKSAASLQQAKNAVYSAEVQVDQAKSDYKAAKKDDTKTSDQKDVLKDKIDIAYDGVTAAKKNYAAALADYDNQLANGAKRKVTAPIAGTVSAVNVKNGDDLGRLSSNSANNAPIIIGDLNTLKAQIQVNEVDIPNVAIGQKVMMTFSAIDGLTMSGKIEKMDALGTISQGVVTYNVTVGFDSLDSRIKPQMSVSAKIITGVKQDVVIVPNSALKTQGNKTYVEVLSNGATTPERRTNIEIGAANSTETEVISGISEGDNVVTQTIDPNAKASTGASSNRGGFPGLGGGPRG